MTLPVPVVAVETTATQFTYSFAFDMVGITGLSVTGTGRDFTYDPDPGDIEPESGFLETLVFTADVVANVAGSLIPVSVPFWTWTGLNREIADLRDSLELGAGVADLLTELPLALPRYDLTVLSSQIIAEEDGTILLAPNPMLVFADDGPAYTGTPNTDHITVLEADRRLDLRAGDDFASAQGNEGSVHVALRRGDDVFLGDIFGLPGSDGITTFVTGGAGNDVLIGGYGMDTLRGGKDDDVILGLEGDDRLSGGAQNDVLFGGDGDDQLFGGAGRDVLNAGTGDNGVRGGVGPDVFWFDFGLGTGTTTVHDFTDGRDKLHLSQFGVLDIVPEEAAALFASNAVQDGADTVFTFASQTVVLKNVDKADIAVDDFYDKPWQLISEFDVYETLF